MNCSSFLESPSSLMLTGTRSMYPLFCINSSIFLRFSGVNASKISMSPVKIDGNSAHYEVFNVRFMEGLKNTLIQVHATILAYYLKKLALWLQDCHFFTAPAPGQCFASLLKKCGSR